MIVMYTGTDEIIVTTEADESQMLAEYFAEGTGRDIDLYDREPANDKAAYEVLLIETRLQATFE